MSIKQPPTRGLFYLPKFAGNITKMIYATITALFLSILYIGWLHLQKFKRDRAIDKFKAFYDLTKETPPELELVATDKFGNNWFGFKNPLEIPAQRNSDLQAATRWGELGMTPEYFAKEMMKVQGLIGKDNNKAIERCGDMLNRATWAAEENTLLMIASQMFLLEGENPIVLTPEFLEKKKFIFDNDVEAKGFFLHSAFKNTRYFNELSETGLTSYLREKAALNTMRKSNLSLALSKK